MGYVRYTKFVGDGDSSVYPSLITEVPQYGHDIAKIKCSNHAVKCYRGALEKLVQEKPHYKGKGGLTSNMRKRLTKAARCAIKMRSEMVDRRQAVQLLRNDLRNGPLHCFGVHTGCSTDFCKAVNTSNSFSSSADCLSTPNTDNSTLSSDISMSSTLSDFSPTSPSTSSTTLLGDCCVNSIVEQKTEIWNDALDEEDLDDVRSSNAAAPDHCDINPELICDVQCLVGRLIAKADQLLGKNKLFYCRGLIIVQAISQQTLQRAR